MNKNKIMEKQKTIFSVNKMMTVDDWVVGILAKCTLFM